MRGSDGFDLSISALSPRLFNLPSDPCRASEEDVERECCLCSSYLCQLFDAIDVEMSKKCARLCNFLQE